MSYFAAILIAAVSLIGLSACKSQAPEPTQDQAQTSAPAAENTEGSAAVDTATAPVAAQPAAPAAPATKKP
jgi:hypothetical protein